MSRPRRPGPAAAWAVSGSAVVLVVAAYVDRLQHLGPVSSADGLLAVSANLLSALGVPVVGAVLVRRVPGSDYGWVWCASGLALAVSDLWSAPDLTALAPPWVSELMTGVGFVATLGSLVLVFLLFPDGRPPAPGWRWLTRSTVVLVLVLWLGTPFARIDGRVATPWPLPRPVGDRIGAALLAGVALLFVLCVFAMAGAVVRWRHAGVVERKQLEWFATAATANAALLVAALLGLDRTGPLDSDGALWQVLASTCSLLMPIAVAVAVLRYRLYEIDRIVSRTVTYGLVTGALLVTYLVLVYLLRRLLEPLTGTTELAVAASTLAVAAAFRPVRRRVQGLVDRRFDRARYDAVRTVEAYARRLRTEVDLHEVAGDLRDTVTATVGPQRVSLWLRDVPNGQGAGS